MMTKEDGLNLFKALNSLGYLSGVKFAYAISKNIGLLKTEVDSLTKADEPYNTARIELAKKYSKKDDKGEPILINNEYQLEDTKTFKAEIGKLQEETPYKDYQELLKEPSDFKPYKMKLADVPVQITVAQMYQIKDLVEE